MYSNEATLLKTAEDKYSAAQAQILALSSETNLQRIDIQSQAEQINELKRQKEALEQMLKESVTALESSQTVNSALELKLNGLGRNQDAQKDNGPEFKSDAKARPATQLPFSPEVEAVSPAVQSIRSVARRSDQITTAIDDSASAQVINAFMQKLKIWNKRLDEIEGGDSGSVN
jgi:hypothetical protein